MIGLQIISKILGTQSLDILENNLITEDYFPEYKEEIEFIYQHNKKYGNVPDKATFLSQFPDITLVEVTESDKYLIDGIKEQYLYEKSVPVVKEIAKLLKTDANAAAEYMIHAVKSLQPNYDLGGVDIIHEADERYKQFMDRKENQDNWFFTTGFPELDEMIHGIQRSEEFIVIVARTNQGKSWILEKICTHVWEIGFNVGFISPEMGANSVGYRFDTLHSHLSNKSLIWANNNVSDGDYKLYVDKLKEKENKFIVSTPKDFDRKITVTKLKNWIKQHKLDLIAVDGITYVTDERAKRGDNKTTTLTNISEDLMELSIEMNVPVLVVVQANRSGVPVGGENDESAPELESIRDSDGIAHNASKVISIRQLKNEILTIQIKKQRFGKVGGKLNYTWDIDTGKFMYMPSEGDDVSEIKQRQERKPRPERKKENKSKEDVF